MNKIFLLAALLITTIQTDGQNVPKIEQSTADSLNFSGGKVVTAYVTSWSETIPDPMEMTHINYAFGHVSPSFDGVVIDNVNRLKQIVALKKQNPKLKVVLSVGGWRSGRFSEMASSSVTRKRFADSCCQIVKELGLDGIDIDWEYPTQSTAQISSSPDDTKNFTLLMHDLRSALGEQHILSCATIASAEYIDFKECIQYLDMVNVMSYDMGDPPYHHSALYPSEITDWMTTSQAVEAHLSSGVPREKLVMGIPLYGRGVTENDGSMTECWHSKSEVPYWADKDGQLVYGYENERSVGIKCQYVIDHDLKGCMYWEYGGKEQEPLRHRIRTLLLKKSDEGKLVQSPEIHQRY
ncbi:chitinase [Xylanibacter ruminicola]|uniref:chitinase n=1 Tax=Xylanibacter ruminicola TaxID=839 RepID=A0A1H5V1L9_XYLRU|nr:glycoside hydrolase family 18 protein [Xylanibacter ruminicola]SEF81070.1 chitinase [Xylanibacter ruminicola]